MPYPVKILKKNWLTTNVLCLTLEKPPFYSYRIGQAVEVTLDLPRFYGDRAPFTLTSLNSDDYLELIIKVYPDHKGITLAISNLREGDKLIIGDPWDSFRNIDVDFLRKHIPDLHRPFYICGPGGFSEQIKNQLVTMGSDPGLVSIGY